MKVKLYKVGKPKEVVVLDGDDFKEKIEQLYTNNGRTKGWHTAFRLSYDSIDEIKEDVVVNIEVEVRR